jgi:hypothetical protein
MSFSLTSDPFSNIPLYKVSQILSLSSRRAQLERRRPDPDLRKVLGHAKLFAEIDSLDWHTTRRGLAPPPSYLSRRGRRVSKSFDDLFDDDYGCDNVHDSSDSQWSSHVEVVNATPPVLWKQHRQEADESDSPSDIEVPILSAHRISYDNLAKLSSPHASDQIRTTVIAIEEVDLTQGSLES